MAIEWIRVSYPRVRDVFIDGRRSGVTNEPLATVEGGQEITLGEPVDYKPRRRDIVVTGTTSASPMPVNFEPKT